MSAEPARRLTMAFTPRREMGSRVSKGIMPVDNLINQICNASLPANPSLSRTPFQQQPPVFSAPFAASAAFNKPSHTSSLTRDSSSKTTLSSESPTHYDALVKVRRQNYLNESKMFYTSSIGKINSDCRQDDQHDGLRGSASDYTATIDAPDGKSNAKPSYDTIHRDLSLSSIPPPTYQHVCDLNFSALPADKSATPRPRMDERLEIPHAVPPSNILRSIENKQAPTLVVETVNEVPIEKVPDSYVGFATLPDQLHRRAVAKGFSFNLMVVGESGLGKSTFINSLFLCELWNGKSCEKKLISQNSNPAQFVGSPPKTVSMRSNKIRLTEKAVSLDLTLIDTPGFGDALDNTGCWDPIIDYIDQRYEEYLNAETCVDRSLPIADNRVHCCLYFIAPTGHGLRIIDVELMKRLDSKVNIIPIIAKSDTFTSDELRRFKEVVRKDLLCHKISIFEFAECSQPSASIMQNHLIESVGSNNRNSDNTLSVIRSSNDSISHGKQGSTAVGLQQKRPPPSVLPSSPFAVVGSNCIIEKDGALVRGRQYPWGFINVECTDHCDFIPLRKLLIRSHMCDIKEKTHRVHYEAYRSRRLGSMSAEVRGIPPHERTLLSRIEEDQRENEESLRRMEIEMEEVFEAKVAEKIKRLEESRASIRKTFENYKKAIEEESRRIDMRRAEFDREKSAERDYLSIKSESPSGSYKQRKSFF